MIDYIILDYMVLFIVMLVLSKMFNSSMALTFIGLFDLLIVYMLITDDSVIGFIPLFTLAIIGIGIFFGIYTKIDYFGGNEDE